LTSVPRESDQTGQAAGDDGAGGDAVGDLGDIGIQFESPLDHLGIEGIGHEIVGVAVAPVEE
jgi:hypothetical protein